MVDLNPDIGSTLTDWVSLQGLQEFFRFWHPLLGFKYTGVHKAFYDHLRLDPEKDRALAFNPNMTNAVKVPGGNPGIEKWAEEWPIVKMPCLEMEVGVQRGGALCSVFPPSGRGGW